MRQFETGATRDGDTSKLDFEGFLAPSVLKRYAEYMNKNREQADGSRRASDNWQLGIPQDAYMKSGFRHFFEWWETHRSTPLNQYPPDEIEEALCALMFNTMGYLFEHLKRKSSKATSPLQGGEPSHFTPCAKGGGSMDLRQLDLIR